MKNRTKIYIATGCEHLRPFVEGLPSQVDGGEVLNDRRNYVRRFEVAGEEVVVKQFARPRPINRLVYGRLRPSKAERTMSYGQQLLRRGISTPRPLAYIDSYDRRGGYYVGYSVTRYDDRAELSEVITRSRAEQMAVAYDLAEFTARMHLSGFTHGDYHEGNLFYNLGADGHYRFSVIDINRGSFGTPSRRQCAKDLILFGFDWEMMTSFVHRYAELMGWNGEATLRLVLRLREWRKFDKCRVRPLVKRLLRIKPQCARSEVVD